MCPLREGEEEEEEEEGEGKGRGEGGTILLKYHHGYLPLSVVATTGI